MINMEIQSFVFQVLLELLTGLPSYQEEREGCDLVTVFTEHFVAGGKSFFS